MGNPSELKLLPQPLTAPGLFDGAKPRRRKQKRIPTDDELAQVWLAQHPGTAFGLGEFRRYGQGFWSIVPEPQVRREILHVLIAAKGAGVRPTAQRIGSVHAIAADLVGVEASRWDSNPDILVLRNGTLDILTMTLREHRAEDDQTSALSFDFDPHVTASVWDYALHSTLPDEAVDFLQEFAGYALTTDTQFESAVWLYGPPGSGKSTILAGLQTMLGARCGVLGLADIERSSFALTHILGKTLLIATEQPASFMQSSHILNALISGESVRVDRKYRDPIDLVTHAKLAWAMNELPRVPDAGNGLFRRVKVIEFPKLDCDPDPQIKDAIKAGGAGILNWALAGLARLRARGRFDVPASVKEATGEFQQANDVPAEFIRECCIVGPNHQIGAQALYEQYRVWCENTGHKAQSSTSIAQDWKRLGFKKARTRSGNTYQGVATATRPLLTEEDK